MKKIISLLFVFIILFTSFFINTSKVNAYSVKPTYRVFDNTANTLGVNIDESVWELYDWFFKEVKHINEGNKNKDLGDPQIWVGVFHTKVTEINSKDNFMVVWRVGMNPKNISNKEKGYSDYLRVKSNIDKLLDSNNSYVLVEYGPKSIAGTKEYTFGTSIGKSGSDNNFSMSLSFPVVIQDFKITSNVQDPNLNIYYDYTYPYHDDYSNALQHHYGYMIINGSSSYGLKIEIDFEACFNDKQSLFWHDYNVIKDTFTFYT